MDRFLKKVLPSLLLALLLLAGGFGVRTARAEIGTDGVYIVEFYGGGGQGTTANYYNNDYILLKNTGTADVSLAGWSIQYLTSAATSTASGKTYALSGTIKAGNYYLIKGAAGSKTAQELPVAADLENTELAISTTTDCKIALVKTTYALSGLTNTNIPTNANIADFVGVTDCSQSLYLGTGPAPKGSATRAVTRTAYGNDNATDWVQAATGGYPLLKAFAATGGNGGGSTAEAGSLVGWTFGTANDPEVATPDSTITQEMNLAQVVDFGGTITGGNFYSHGTTTIAGASVSKRSFGAANWNYEDPTVEDGKGFYFSFYTTNYKQIMVSFWAQSSKEGPKYLQLQAKVDDVWTDVPGGLLTLDVGGTGKSLSAVYVNLPVWDSDALVEMRIARMGDVRCESNTGEAASITSTGSCQIDDLIVTGVAMSASETLAAAPGAVTAVPMPDSGTVSARTIVTLSCETESAAICYRQGNGVYQTINNHSTVVVYNGAPIYAFGTLDGAYGGAVATFDYTIDNTSEEIGAVSGNGPVVIEELYGSGGNKGSMYTSDYIVLRNISDAAVDIGGWSLLYASRYQAFSNTQAPTKCFTFASGTTIRAHGYLLVKCSAGVSQVGAYDLPNVDVEACNEVTESGVISYKYLTLSATGGKVALVQDANTCSGSDDPNLIDYVCWGSPNDYLGNGPAPVTDTLDCLTRAKTGDEGTMEYIFGGMYTGDNQADFLSAWPSPKSAVSPCCEEEYIAPVTSPDNPVLFTGDGVTLECATAGAVLYYSVDGGANWILYTGTIYPADGDNTLEFTAYATRDMGGYTVEGAYTAFGFAFVSPDGNYTIKQARAIIDHEVTVTGVVTFLEERQYSNYSMLTFTIQDDTAAIAVRGYSYNLEGVQVGREVTITGMRDSYKGLKQIQQAKRKEDTTPTLATWPTPVTATAAQLLDYDWAEAHESQYIALYGVRMDTINYNAGYGGTPPATAVIDETGAVNIHYIPTLDNIQKGDVVNVYAVLTQNAQDVVTNTDGFYLRIQDQTWIELVERPVDPADEYTLAAWDQGTGNESNQMLASGGAFAWRSVVSTGDAVTDQYKVEEPPEGVEVPTYAFTSSKSSIKTTGWNAEGRYIEFAFSTKDYTDIKLSARVRSSSAGPRNFKMQYSFDGVTFTDIEGGTITVMHNELNDTLMQLLNRRALPAYLADRDTVYLRWVLVDLMRADSTGVIGSVGSFNFTAVHILGTKVADAMEVTASPAAGEVSINTTVTLTGSGTNTYYRRYVAPTYEEGEAQGALVDLTDDNWLLYSEESKPLLDALPYVLQAYTETDGVRSRVFTFDYTQAKVAPIKSTAYTGTVRADTPITLSTETAGATIHASVTRNYGTGSAQTTSLSETDALHLTFTEESFPVRVEAYGTKTGYADSELLVLDYTLKVAGGEKLYFGQIHGHTSLSDGVGTIEDAFRYAKNTAKNVDYIIVTDHSNYFDNAATLGTMDGASLGYDISYVNDAGDTVNISKWELGHLMADRYTDATFVGNYGYEMTWTGQYGHMNTYATDGFVSRNNGVYTIRDGQGLQNYYKLLTQYPQSISMFNHPGTTFGTFDDFAYYSESYDAVIALIEVGNGEGAVSSGGYWPSYEQYDRALSKGWHLAPANNQDNHKGRWGDANTARDVVWTNDFTQNGIYQAMREMRQYATEDNNLEILYFLNDEPMGTVFETTPNALQFHVSVFDPNTGDKNFKLSVIADNGVTVYTESGVIGAEAKVFDFTLEPNYSYYYIRIDQADGDIAVTAPIWVGEVLKLGVASLTADVSVPVTNEAFGLKTALFNNESAPFEVTRVAYTVVGSPDPFYVDTTPFTVAAGAEMMHEATYTSATSGALTIQVAVTGVFEGRSCTFTATLETNVRNASDVLTIAVDASHDNAYISGDSAAQYMRLKEIAGLFDANVVLLENGISEAALDGVSLLIITAPYAGWGAASKAYSTAEVAAIKAYANAGGNLFLSGKADRGNGANSGNAALNALLAALDSDVTLRSDVVVDTQNATDASYRFSLGESACYNAQSRFLAGVLAESSLAYGSYAGASVQAGANAIVLVHGNANTFATSYANLNAAKPYLPIDTGSYTVRGTNTALVTSETLAGGGFLVVSGMAFFNDYQIPETENLGQVQNVNYYLTRNIILSSIAVSTIQEARDGMEGAWFCVEGTVTTNASGHSVNTAFFDSIYLQNETGGINLFPVNGAYSVGQTLWVTGYRGAYQGDAQLNDVSVYLMDAVEKPLSPTKVSTRESMSKKNAGKLVVIEGEIKSFSLNEGVLEYITVSDGSGEARVFLDGYITSDTAYDLGWIAVGKAVRVVGVASVGMHPDASGVDQLLPRIRVRDRAEIVQITSFESGALLGDVNCDTTVTSADAALLLRAIVGLSVLSEQGKINAEVSGDTVVTTADAAMILRYCVGLIKVFPAA